MRNITSFIKPVISVVLLMAVVFLFAQCGDEDKAPALSYTIDGESQSVTSVSGVMQSQVQYDHEGRALYITAAKGFDKILSVAVTNWDFQGPPANGILTGEYDATYDFEDYSVENPLEECLELEGGVVTLCSGGLVTLIDGTNLYFSFFDGPTDASITITSCNTDNKTVSGTFNAKLGTLDGETIVTVAGSFTDVKYTIQ